MTGMPTTSRRRPPRPTPTVQVAVIEIFAEVLAPSEEEGLVDDFYSRLCEGITRCTALRRVVIFRYDSARRRFLAAGSYGVDLALFADDFFTLESRRSPARRSSRTACSRPRGPRAPVARRVRRAAAARTVVCSPMSARGRWLGAILGDRGGEGAAADDSEREVLWILGKMAALAAMARAATRQHERAVALEQRIDLAREVHEGVVQRLFGVSLALSGDQPFDEETRRRCAEEVQAALADLRTAMQRPLGRSAAATTTTLAEEFERLRHATPSSGSTLEGGHASRCPGARAARAVGARRGDPQRAKHAAPATRRRPHRDVDDGTFVLEVTNDGARGRRRGPAGHGPAAGRLRGAAGRRPARVRRARRRPLAGAPRRPLRGAR